MCVFTMAQSFIRAHRNRVCAGVFIRLKRVVEVGLQFTGVNICVCVYTSASVLCSIKKRLS